MKLKKNITIYDIASNLAQIAGTLYRRVLNKGIERISTSTRDIALELGYKHIIASADSTRKHKVNSVETVGHELKSSSITTIFSNLEKITSETGYHPVVHLTGISNIKPTYTIVKCLEWITSSLKKKVHTGSSVYQ